MAVHDTAVLSLSVAQTLDIVLQEDAFIHPGFSIKNPLQDPSLLKHNQKRGQLSTSSVTDYVSEHSEIQFLCQYEKTHVHIASVLYHQQGDYCESFF